jgi:hypothetical protein
MPKASEPTRIYLSHRRTGQLFQGPGRWSDRHEEALAFRHGDQALRFVCEHDLREVELCLVLPDQQRHLRIPLNRVA